MTEFGLHGDHRISQDFKTQPTLHVFNIGTEHSFGGSDDRKVVMLSSQRNIWQVRAGDMVILPYKLEDDFIEYFEKVAGVPKPSVQFSVLNELITDSVLRRTISEIAEIAQDFFGSPPLRLNACYHTPEIHRLWHHLRDPQGSKGFRNAIATFRGFDRKSVFRDYCHSAGLPIPLGQHASSLAEAAKFISSALNWTGHVIAKPDDGAGAIGNILVSCKTAAALPGTSAGLKVKELTPDAIELELELSGLSDGMEYVYEVYHPWKNCFYLEYDIASRSVFNFNHSGDVFYREPTEDVGRTPLWKGLGFPSRIASSALSEAQSICEPIVGYAAENGARGKVNIDLIMTCDDKLYVNEANVRWGGGTGAMSFVDGRRGRTDQLVARTTRGLNSRSLTEASAKLNDAGFDFGQSIGSGALVQAFENGQPGNVDLLIIARTHPEVDDLLASVWSLFEGR